MQKLRKQVSFSVTAVFLLGTVFGNASLAETKTFALDSAQGLALHNVQAEPVTFKGDTALRVTISEEAARRDEALRERRQAQGAGATKKADPGALEQRRADHLAIIEGVDFGNGVVEVVLAAEPAPGASGGARGFVGVAWRLQPDRKTYDAFYLRPTNGRAEDQERRNHSAQYISHPGWPWFRLRQETPSKYESYVDIGPAEWIHVKIDVRGQEARLYVNGHEQPTLIVNDVKSGANTKGAVALWIEGSTLAYFRDLKITY